MQGRSKEEQEFKALLEDVNAELRHVAEGHSGLTKEIKETRTRIEKRVDDLEQALFKGFDKVWQAINRVDSHLSEISLRFGAHERSHMH